MKPTNSIAYFQYVKQHTEAIWDNLLPGDDHHIQPGSKWRPGLSEAELHAFETEMGFIFPEPLRDFYRTMNGLDRPGAHGGNFFYSYPDHLPDIRDTIQWILEANRMTPELMKKHEISRIFPIWIHRCIMIDDPGYPVLSMYGNDIIFLAYSLADAMRRDLLNGYYGRQQSAPYVRFWYPGWRQYPKLPKRRPLKGKLWRFLRKEKYPLNSFTGG